MRTRVIATGLLIATGGGAAVAQIAGGASSPLGGQATLKPMQLSPDLRQSMEVDRLTKEVARLTDLTAALDAKLTKTTQRLDTLQYHFENHRHSLRGYVGSGISSALDGDHKVITYLTPYSREDENKDASVTNPPMK